MTPLTKTALAAIFGVLVLGSAFADTSDTAESKLTREQWYARLKWPTTDCPLEAPSRRSSGVHVRDLGNGAALIEIECERWAYQGTRLIYVRKGASLTRLELDQFEAPDAGRLEPYRSAVVTGLVTVKPPAVFYVLRKYRGAGDCGQYLRYDVRDAQAVLTQMRVRECSERSSASAADPEKWPVRKR